MKTFTITKKLQLNQAALSVDQVLYLVGIKPDLTSTCHKNLINPWKLPFSQKTDLNFGDKVLSKGFRQ